MRSAYANASSAGEPAFTTWKIREDGEHVQTLDYIFHTEAEEAEEEGGGTGEEGRGGGGGGGGGGGLRVDRVLGFPSGDDLGPGRLPCEAFASDHMSLVADFTFAGPKA